MNYSPLYPLSETCEEVVFAPFHDPLISPSLDIQLKNTSDAYCEINYIWCWTDLVWEVSEAESGDAEFILSTYVDITNYDKIIYCLSAPENLNYSISNCVDGEWIDLTYSYQGKGERDEILIDVSGHLLTGIKIKFASNNVGKNVIHLSWFGLQNSDLTETVASAKEQFGSYREDLILDPQEWAEIRFEKNLLFSPDILPKLRQKKTTPAWSVHFKYLEDAAEKYLLRDPEKDLGMYLPLDDFRYMRSRKSEKSPYHWEALVLGFVGLVNNNHEMMHHALRYLSCMVYTPNWVQSAESKLSGSTWDQRCFIEEMTTTSVVILADWFSFALSSHAKELIRQSIWDKGLATIERDMMKYDYLYQSNQGIGFCRARILGGLYLQGEWPHIGSYVDRAYTDMMKIFDHYVHADGGIDEGGGYFCQSFQGALFGIVAYARSKETDFSKILKKKFKKTEKYISAISSTVPGKMTPTGDCRTDDFCGDVIPVMAAVLPDSVYSKILKPCIEKGSVFSVTGLMSKSGGILGFVYGPELIQKPQCIVPRYLRLPITGILSSYRKIGENSVRLQLYGSRPYPSHSHFDKGGITLEINDKPVLIDRGMVSYTNMETVNLWGSSFHNVLTVVTQGQKYLNQDIPSLPIIPKGKGSKSRLSASVELQNVWRSHMTEYIRSIESSGVENISLIDKGELKSDGVLAFHLHSTYPFEKNLNDTVLKTEGFEVRIIADWANSVLCEQKSINHNMDPVYTATIYSQKCKKFNFTTNLIIKYCE